MAKYTKEKLLEFLKAWAKEHNKNPSKRDIRKDKSMPSIMAYTYHFGTFNSAKELAGLKTYGYTKEKLLELLKAWAKKHNKSPTASDLEKDKSMPVAETYMYHFGTFNSAKELAGLEINRNRENTYTEDVLLRRLNEWAKIHKKSPSARDIDKDESMPDPKTYIYHFGTFNKAKELAGLPLFEHDSELNYVGNLIKEWREGRKGEIADNTIIGYLRTLKHLEDFLKENNKIMKELTIIDIKNYILEIKEMYSRRTMQLKFNAIRNFLKYFFRKAIIEKTKPLFDLAMIEYIDVFFKKLLRQMEDDREEDEALSEEEVEIIKEKLKDYPLFDTMFQLDLNLGLRASEFVKIKAIEGLISNRRQARKADIWIDLSRGILMIYRGKSRRPHLVALTQEMVQLVKKQLTLRKLYGVSHKSLFFSKKGKPLRGNIISSYYREISNIVGFKVTSHKVRRTMSTMLEKRGIPHSIIRMRMGHAPKDTTQLYQRYPIQERQQILEEKVGVL